MNRYDIYNFFKSLGFECNELDNDFKELCFESSPYNDHIGWFVKLVEHCRKKGSYDRIYESSLKIGLKFKIIIMMNRNSDYFWLIINNFTIATNYEDLKEIFIDCERDWKLSNIIDGV